MNRPLVWLGIAYAVGEGIAAAGAGAPVTFVLAFAARSLPPLLQEYLPPSIIGNVLDTSLHAQCEQLVIGHEFQEPFGEDIADDLNNISKAVDAGILSTEGAIELNPLPIDKQREKERLAEEAEERQRTQASIFGDIAGAGAQSYGDGSSRDDDDDDADEDDESNKSQNKKSDKTKK